jgi:hypothetical protein
MRYPLGLEQTQKWMTRYERHTAMTTIIFDNNLDLLSVLDVKHAHD